MDSYSTAREVEKLKPLTKTQRRVRLLEDAAIVQANIGQLAAAVQRTIGQCHIEHGLMEAREMLERLIIEFRQ